jgi:Tol biopolymer transport system component
VKRLVTIAVASAATMLGLSAAQPPLQAKAPEPNGQIVFQRYDPTICKGCTSTYTVNPDGTHQQLLLRSSGTPYWSPDGTLLACDVVSDTPGYTGLYTIRSSDGGGLTKLISCADECGAADWSPDGKRFLVGGPDPDGLTVLFVVRVNGTGLRQVSPSGIRVDLENGVASWSPSGDQILFGGNADADHRRSIFVVNADGSGFHQVPISGCGGAFSDRQSIACFEPGWSPDGTKIVFVRSSVMFGTTAIYTANADGSGFSQVTHPTNLGVGSPDWGTHPLAT